MLKSRKRLNHLDLRDQASTTVVTAPKFEPVRLDEVKNYVNEDRDTNDTLLQGLIEAARRYVENDTSRTLITTTLRLTLDLMPGPGRPVRNELANNTVVPLDLGPVQSITKIRTFDDDDVSSTVDSSAYRLDSARDQLVFDDLPTGIDRNVGGLEIDYVTGYGDQAKDVPESFKAAIFMLVAHWFEMRGVAVQETGTLDQIPLGVDAILSQYRRIRI